jgi:signal transduction histidine kinase
MIRLVNKRLRVTIDEDYYGLLRMVALLTITVGYIVALTNSYRLNLWIFLVFTAITLGWVALLMYLESPGNSAVKITLLLSGMTALALAGIFCLPLGTNFDWILPTVTAAVVALARGWRPALLVIVLFMLATVVAFWLVRSPWSEIANTATQTLTAYVFATIFAAVIRRQQQLRERAEALASAVSQANTELAQAHEELRARASQAEELTISRERNRMAREIHDTLGHYLTILAVQLETALKQEEHGDSGLHATLHDARRVAVESLTEVRRSVVALRPGDISEMSLAGALQRLVDESAALTPETKITLDIEESAVDPPLETRAALYRCAQEALTNVRKHAAADKVLVRLRITERSAELTVLDNGSRAGAAAPDGYAPGFGLLGMRERMALLGGSAAAGPEPKRGWRVEAQAPMSTVEASGVGNGNV